MTVEQVKAGVLAAHRPGTGCMYNGFSHSYLTCSCGWQGEPGDPDGAGLLLAEHLVDVTVAALLATGIVPGADSLRV